jgi:hypothetical protein
MSQDYEPTEPFGTLAIAIFMMVGGVLLVIRELSAFLGMPW